MYVCTSRGVTSKAELKQNPNICTSLREWCSSLFVTSFFSTEILSFLLRWHTRKRLKVLAASSVLCLLRKWITCWMPRATGHSTYYWAQPGSIQHPSKQVHKHVGSITSLLVKSPDSWNPTPSPSNLYKQITPSSPTALVQGTSRRFSEDIICQAQMLHAVTQTQHCGAAVGTGRARVARVETHDLEEPQLLVFLVGWLSWQIKVQLHHHHGQQHHQRQKLRANHDHTDLTRKQFWIWFKS